MARLDQRTALVTGAAKGIGKAVAIRLAEEGARVVLTDIDADGLYEAVRTITDAGGAAIGVVADATEEADVDRAMAAARESFGPVDVLVNNVGLGKAGRIWELSVEDWDAIMRINLRSMFLFTRAAVRPMMERGYGRIICMSSGAREGTVWNSYYRGACAYSTAKAGVHGFIRDMAIELAEHGINVNAVAPGPIDTELAGPYLKQMDADGMVLSPTRLTPLGRLGTPREVADAVLFLASDEASYITGITLDVLGGR
jgi:3-oxoacyl-[acyl-carrier protein] reductase